jgi:hypothetical protein
MKRKIFLMTALLVAFIGLNAQDTSMYKIEEEHWTIDETDYSRYRYKPVDLVVRKTTVYMHDPENWQGYGQTLNSDQAHFTLFANTGEVATGDKYFHFRYNDVETTDTLQVSMFYIDSMQGDALFNHYLFIAEKRENLTSIVDNKSAKEISVYPNPTRDVIHLPETFEVFKYSVYSTEGKIISSSTTEGGEINLWYLKPGVYLLRLYDGKDFYTSKFVKQ